MTNQAQRPKPNFLLTLCWSIGLYMLLMTVCGRNQASIPPTPSNVNEIYQQLLADNRDRKDFSILEVKKAYQAVLDQLVKDKKMTQSEEDAKLIEATILVADTRLKAGIHSNETWRVRNAFYTLAGYERKDLNQPEWNKPYPVTDVSANKMFGWKEWSGQQLYKYVRDDLATRNRSELAWGFIPGYQIIDALVSLTGRAPGFSYAFAAFLLAFLVRAIVFPLSQRQIMYGRQMSQLTPLLKEIKAKYGDDQLAANQQTMALYKEYGLNPMAGCAPMLVQMPFFFAIYQCMLRYQFTFENGTFLWINPSANIASHGFFAANLGQMDALLTIIYGITMVVSTLLMPVTDPTQVKQQRMMGVGMSVVMTFFMFTGAIPVVSGFVLYWTFTNILATAQSLRAYRLPLPPLVKVNAPGGGVFPGGGGGRMSKWAKWYEEAQKQALDQHRADQDHKTNGSASNGSGSNGKTSAKDFLGTGETKTGTPAKHKPKKRK